MNHYVQYDNAIPILVDVPRWLSICVNTVVETGYVLEIVSKAGIASTHIGYKYLVTGIEILLTEENMQTPKAFFEFLSEIFSVKGNVIKRAIDVSCASCRYEAFRKFVLDDADRKRITENAFSKLDVLSMLGYFVSHCVDRAEQMYAELLERKRAERAAGENHSRTFM